MANILEVSNISKVYKKNVFALHDISFVVPQGAIMGVVGENGSGKTTTLGIILGLRHQDFGTVRIFDRPYHMDDISMKEKIGVVFDGNYFPHSFTPREISKIFQRVYRSWDVAYFIDLLKKYDISEKQKVKNMSRGTQATLAILTALSQKPDLLILDEPTNGIDPMRREEILELFLEFVSDGKKSIVFSSHITSDLEKIADYITIIHDGKLLASAEKDLFIYKYGVIRCNQEVFDELCRKHKQEVLRYVKRDYQYRILVRDQSCLSLNDIVLENPTLEEAMYLLTRGENV